MTPHCLQQANAATCLAQRDFGEPTAATPAPARMGVLVYLKMATVCAHQGSEAPPARSVRLTVPQPLLLAVQTQGPHFTPRLWPLTPISRIVNPGESGQGESGQGPPDHHAPLSPACPPGRYGKRCMPCKCNNHSSCGPLDGTCYCLAGWTGPDCSECA